jgi:hypothetical protein
VKWTVPCSGGSLKDVDECRLTELKAERTWKYASINEARTSVAEGRTLGSRISETVPHMNYKKSDELNLSSVRNGGAE